MRLDRETNNRFAEQKKNLLNRVLREIPSARAQLGLDDSVMIGDYIGGGSFGQVFELVYRGKAYHNPEVLKFAHTSMYDVEEKAEHIEKMYEIDTVNEILRDLQNGGYEEDQHLVRPIAAATGSDDTGEFYIIRMRKETPVTKKNNATPEFKSIISTGKTPFSELALRLGLHVATALEFLHDRDIIHRDVKLDNIFYMIKSSDNEVSFHLGDFNTCRKIGRSVGDKGGTLLGTPGYCPRDWFDKLAPVRDIYALGASMYIFLDDFSMINFEKMLEKQSKEQRSIRDDWFIPPRHGTRELNRIIRKALNTEERFNYKKAKEIHQDLIKVYEQSESERQREQKTTENEVKPSEPSAQKIPEQRRVVKDREVNVRENEPFQYAPKTPKEQFALAENYATGRTVKKDPVKAAYWCRQAAMNEHERAQNVLSSYYESGFGVIKNIYQSSYWYELFVSKLEIQSPSYSNTPEKEFELAEVHAKGNNSSPVRAAYWYKRAAEHGHYKAQLALSSCYRNGFGVPISLEEAEYWYSRSLSNPNNPENKRKRTEDISSKRREDNTSTKDSQQNPRTKRKKHRKSTNVSIKDKIRNEAIVTLILVATISIVIACIVFWKQSSMYSTSVSLNDLYANQEISLETALESPVEFVRNCYTPLGNYDIDVSNVSNEWIENEFLPGWYTYYAARSTVSANVDSFMNPITFLKQSHGRLHFISYISVSDLLENDPRERFPNTGTIKPTNESLERFIFAYNELANVYGNPDVCHIDSEGDGAQNYDISEIVTLLNAKDISHTLLLEWKMNRDRAGIDPQVELLVDDEQSLQLSYGCSGAGYTTDIKFWY